MVSFSKMEDVLVVFVAEEIRLLFFYFSSVPFHLLFL